MNNNSHDDWDNLFEQLPLDTTASDSHRETLKQQALDAFDASESVRSKAQPNPVSVLSKLGQNLMKYKAPYWTAAAILVGCVFWMTQDSSRAFAFENFIDEIDNCKTYRYVMEMDLDGEKLVSKYYYRAPNQYRFEYGDDSVSLADSTTKKKLDLNTAARTARISNFTSLEECESGNQFSIEHLKESFLEFADDSPNEIKSLGERVIDGKATIGYQVDAKLGLTKGEGEPASELDMKSRISLWEDSASGRPVLIEMEMMLMGEMRHVLTIKDFEFDIDLEPSLFSMDVPAGYKLEAAVEEELSEFAEEAEFVSALKKLSTSIGEFPASFNADQLELLMTEYAKRENLTLDVVGVEKFMNESIELMTPLLTFPIAMFPSADAHYAPKGVAVGDSSKAIFWYKPVDSKTYRVIYGDFSVKEQSSPPAND